jgi:predicted Ser/Thr protein kinase
MTPEQFRRVRELFEQAVDLEPSELAAWIERQAGDDPDVRRELDVLLRANSKAGSFLSGDLIARLPDLLTEDAGLRPGDPIGSYIIEREIGRGGMGHVYLAHDANLNRKVAIKALAPRLVRDETQKERLRREARAAAGLKHPGICTVHTLEEKDGNLFIVSEYVEGRTLREEIESGQKPSASVVSDTASQLAEALASAHEKNITHRDLKPENLMRTVDGRMKILDFGLALDLGVDAGQPRMTQLGTLIGTLGYMAPEQLNGEPVDARSDVFAFGVVMYEFASGQHPFEAPSAMGTVGRVLESQALPLSERCPALPRTLVGVIERSLQKAPGRRFQSAAEIVTALDAGEPAAETVPPVSIATWWRRHQVSAILLYLVAAALAWQVKEWMHALANLNFLLISVAATVAGMFRGFLVFSERMNPAGFDFELRRAKYVLTAADLVISLALALDGFITFQARPLVSVLTIAVAVVITFLLFVAEPTTTKAAFERRSTPLQ